MEVYPLIVSIAEAARLLSIGRSQVYRAISAGQLRTHKSGRRNLIETAELRRFVNELPPNNFTADTEGKKH